MMAQLRCASSKFELGWMKTEKEKASRRNKSDGEMCLGHPRVSFLPKTRSKCSTPKVALPRHAPPVSRKLSFLLRPRGAALSKPKNISVDYSRSFKAWNLDWDFFAGVS